MITGGRDTGEGQERRLHESSLLVEQPQSTMALRKRRPIKEDTVEDRTDETARRPPRRSHGLHVEILAFAKENNAELVTQYGVHIALNALRDIVAARWADARAELYGSRSVPGLALPSSDMDVVLVNVPVSAAGVRDALQLLSDDLQERGWVIENFLPTSRVPVLKLQISHTIRADITMASTHSHTGLASRDLLLKFAMQAPPIAPISLVLKKLLRSRSLNDAWNGGISSYCLMVLLHEEAARARWSSVDDHGAMLVRFLKVFVNRFENQHALVYNPLAPPMIIQSENIMQSCSQISSICQLFRNALWALSPDNPNVGSWEEYDGSLLDLFFGARAGTTTIGTAVHSLRSSVCSLRSGSSHTSGSSHSSMTGCSLPQILQSDVCDVDETVMSTGGTRPQTPLQHDFQETSPDPPPDVAETMRGDIHDRTSRLRIVLAFAILWFVGIMTVGVSPTFRHAFGSVFFGLALYGAVCLLVGSMAGSKAVSQWYAGPAAQARFTTHVMMATHAGFGALSLLASLLTSYEDFYSPSQRELYWQDPSILYWALCTPLLLLMVGTASVTNLTSTRELLLGGGLGQLLLLLAQGYWLAKMWHNFQTVFMSVAILSTQQLGYVLGVVLGFELLSGHKAYYEEGSRLKLQLLQNRIESLRMEKERLDYDRQMAQRQVVLLQSEKRPSTQGSLVMSNEPETACTPPASEAPGTSCTPLADVPDAGGPEASAPPTIVSMSDLGPSVKLPQDEVSSRHTDTQSVGGWSQISALLRTELQQQQGASFEMPCAPGVWANGSTASPTYGINSVSTSAQPITMLTPTLDPRARPWTPPDMAFAPAPIPARTPPYMAFARAPILARTPPDMAFAPAPIPARTPPDMAVAPAPILALSSAALTAKPATTDTSAHENELKCRAAQCKKNNKMRLKQLVREIANTENERTAMGLAPLQHDIDSIPACCNTCRNVRRLSSFWDNFSGQLKIKVFAGDATETAWDAQSDHQAAGLPALMEDADASPIDCRTCGNKQILKLLVMRRPGDLKILIVASHQPTCQPPGFCSNSTSTESNKGGRVIAGRYVSPCARPDAFVQTEPDTRMR